MNANDQRESTVLVTVDILDQSPDSALVAATMGVPEAAIERAFGIVLIDPSRKRYAVKVDAAAFAQRSHKRGNVSGPFSDTLIGSMQG